MEFGTGGQGTNDAPAGASPVGRTEKTSERIARLVLRDLVARSAAPGERLPPEAVMVAHYGVGRASVREALRILEVHGLITIKSGPGGGPVVGSVDASAFGHMATLYFHMQGATVRDLAQARVVIEPLMAGLAADRRDQEGLAAVKRAANVRDEALLAGDTRYMQLATDFHGAVAGSSGNPILDLIGRALKDIFARKVRGSVYPVSYRERVIDAHLAIADAIAAGDKLAAVDLMRLHMEDYLRVAETRHGAILDEVVDWS